MSVDDDAEWWVALSSIPSSAGIGDRTATMHKKRTRAPPLDLHKAAASWLDAPGHACFVEPHHIVAAIRICFTHTYDALQSQTRAAETQSEFYRAMGGSLVSLRMPFFKVLEVRRLAEPLWVPTHVTFQRQTFFSDLEDSLCQDVRTGVHVQVETLVHCISAIAIATAIATR